ncbi:restriction endonuclease subunit S, partial [Ilyobacter sp.]|uniref:restriction endonuclease subunit S n=1 Tax=Ilyobacter sp. TaxID=3100343 RepID=UPI003563EFDD
EDMIPNQLFFIIKVDKRKCNPKYITWYLQSKDVMRYLDKFTSGSVIKAVNKKILEEVEIPLPDKSKQDKFVELLENFENEKNATLEYLEMKENLINEKIIISLKGAFLYNNKSKWLKKKDTSM